MTGYYKQIETAVISLITHQLSTIKYLLNMYFLYLLQYSAYPEKEPVPTYIYGKLFSERHLGTAGLNMIHMVWL